MKEKEFQHGMANVAEGVRLHYVSAGSGGRPLLLLHGFPETWSEWRHMIGPLAEAGFHVIAPDYRGAGNSSRPAAGYDKLTLATDLHSLLHEYLNLTDQIAIVGHDIGLMVAYAYAQTFRKEVSHLAVIDAPLPGTKVFERLRSDSRLWQFSFHNALDIPEMLVQGREHAYLQAFIQARIFNPGLMDEATIRYYAETYSAPGAMRAGFNLFRTLEDDARYNQQKLVSNGKLSIPVLAVGGAISTLGPLMSEMMSEVAEIVTTIQVPESSHFVPEEKPTALVEALLQFLKA